MIASRHLAVAALLCAISVASQARAGDKETAKTLFDDAVTQMEAGRYERACPSLKESYRLDPHAGTLFALAECEAKRGRIASALQRYDEYLALYATLPPDKKAKQGDRERESLAQRAALSAEAPRLTLLLSPGAPRGTVVVQDGEEIDAARLGVPLIVDPGEHLVTTRAPGGPEAEVRVTLVQAEKKTLTLQVKEVKEVKDAASVATPPPRTIPRSAFADAASQDKRAESSAGPSAQRIGAYVAGGVGVAGLFLGGVTGGMMLAKKGVVDAQCNANGLCKSREGVDAGNSAKTLGLISTVGWGVAIAGAAAATVLVVTEGPRPTQAHARWVGVGVRAAGPGGAVVGVHGAW